MIVLPLMNATQHQGGSHTFVCAAVAYPPPVFVFSFNGARIVSNSSKHTLVTNSTQGTLTVLNLQTSDEGTYTCSASNRYGNVSSAAVLSVQGTFAHFALHAIVISEMKLYDFLSAAELYCRDLFFLCVCCSQNFLPNHPFCVCSIW